MRLLAAAPAPWWLVVPLVLVGLGVGLLLARQLSTLGYRLDDETGPAPAPRWCVAVAVPVLWGGLAWQLGGLAHATVLPAFLLLAAVGVALAWVDLDVHRLPEGLTLPTILALLVLLVVAAAVTGSWGTLLRAVVCGLVAGLVYVVLALLVPGGLGFGDCVLGGLVSLPLGYLGWSRPVVAFLAAYLVGGLLSVVLVVLRRVSLKGHIAFGPFILLGGLVALVVGFAGFQDLAR